MGLQKTYANGTRALRHVNLHVGLGEIVTLLGLSGAGKSTLMRCVNGLVRPTRGQVGVDGLLVDGTEATLRTIRQRVGMIFQQFNLVGRLTVLENVLTGRLAHRPMLPTLLRRFPPEDYDLAEAGLRRVGLAHAAGQRADTLSGGERQRVAIARVLAQQPKVLLADEPVASLDPRTAGSILDLLQTICREDGLTVLMSLHQVHLAKQGSHRIVGIAAGAVVFEGAPAALNGAALEAIYGGRIDEAGDEDEHASSVALLAHA